MNDARTQMPAGTTGSYGSAPGRRSDARREPAGPSRRIEGLAARPDRVAMWAFLMAIGVTAAAAASA